MRALFLAVFLLLALSCRSQYVCEPDDDNFDACGCTLNTTNPFPVRLDEFNETLVWEDENSNEYYYGGCQGVPEIEECEVDAAVCVVDSIGNFSYGIGNLDNITYNVEQINPKLSLSVTYNGDNGSIAIVILKCDPTADNATFMLHSLEDGVYTFYLYDVIYCIPPMPTTTTTMTTTMTTTTTTTTVTPTNTTHTVKPTNTTHMPTTTRHMMTTTHHMSTTSHKTVAPTATNQPKENKNDKDRKVVLGIVLSIVAAIVVGCIAGVVVYLIWKKKKGVNYEKIPSM